MILYGPWKRGLNFRAFFAARIGSVSCVVPFRSPPLGSYFFGPSSAAWRPLPVVLVPVDPRWKAASAGGG
eukprot:313277-Chlamydomonas_euryale.AAC.1